MKAHLPEEMCVDGYDMHYQDYPNLCLAMWEHTVQVDIMELHYPMPNSVTIAAIARPGRAGIPIYNGVMADA